MSRMHKPIIVACPGAWHSPIIYSGVFSHLECHGYQTVGQSLPSLGGNPPVSSFDPDVIAIRETLTKLIVEEERDVILVMHSFSGMSGSEAPVGLGKNEREEKGLRGGLVRLVYIAAFVPLEGFNPVAAMGAYAPWMDVDKESGVIRVSQEDAIPLFYNDLPAEEAAEWASRLEPQSLGPYSSITTYAAWRYIPSTFILPTRDSSIPNLESFVDFLLQTARAEQPTAFDIVEKIDGGHCVMVSRPKEVAQALMRAAGEQCD